MARGKLVNFPESAVKIPIVFPAADTACGILAVRSPSPAGIERQKPAQDEIRCKNFDVCGEEPPCVSGMVSGLCTKRCGMRGFGVLMLGGLILLTACSAPAESQRRISETLSLMADSGNSVFVTTHSPYVLGTFNYLLMAGQVAENHQEEVAEKLDKRLWLKAGNVNAHYISDGKLTDGISDEDGLRLIRNELIDGASSEINDMSDYLLGFLYAEGDE